VTEWYRNCSHREGAPSSIDKREENMLPAPQNHNRREEHSRGIEILQRNKRRKLTIPKLFSTPGYLLAKSPKAAVRNQTICPQNPKI
jgi:hypothetical protein